MHKGRRYQSVSWLLKDTGIIQQSFRLFVSGRTENNSPTLAALTLLDTTERY